MQNLKSKSDDIQGTAAELATQFLNNHREAATDWRNRNLGDEAKFPREEIADRLTHLMAEANAEAMRWGCYLLSYLCNRRDPGIEPTVTTEVIGRTVKLIVQHDGVWVGTQTIFLAGGSEACLMKDNLAVGSYVEVAGGLFSGEFCFYPEHHAKETV